MTLFKRLFRQSSLEDFHTEIVGHLLESSPDLRRAWLKELELDGPYCDADASVTVQARFGPLEHHATANRPDLVLTLRTANGSRGMVVVESKLGAQEGLHQLRRYAEVLAAIPDLERRVLVYATRDHDPKSEGLARDLPASVKLVEYRWFRFYRLLASQPADSLIAETLRFMEEHGMAQRNQFTASDLLSLSNFPRALGLMDATLWGAVKDRFQAVAGGVSQPSSSTTQIRNHGRYVMYTSSGAGMWYVLGYFLQRDDPAEYPLVGVRIEVEPGASGRADMIERLQVFRQTYPLWKPHRLDEPRAWSALVATADLREFLAADDHVVAVESYFLNRLTEVEALR